MKMLSDKARLLWPHLLVASNTVGRIEINYRKVINRAFVDFRTNPFADEREFLSVMGEYQDAYLLFVYEVNGQIWGQWDAPKNTWQRHPLDADKLTPAAPVEAMAEWLKGYRERIQPKPFNLKTFTIPPQTSEVPRETVRGVGVGLGVGKARQGKAEPKTSQATLPDWIPVELWDEYAKMRVKVRKPMTPGAAKLVIAKLESYRSRGIPIREVLEASILNSWQDVYEPKGGNHGKPKAQDRQDTNTGNIAEAVSRRVGTVDGGSTGGVPSPDNHDRNGRRLPERLGEDGGGMGSGGVQTGTGTRQADIEILPPDRRPV